LAKSTATITLDAFFITYYSSPLGSPDRATWTRSRHYENNVRIASPVNPDLQFESIIHETQSRVFLGSKFLQSNSGMVERALTLREDLGRGLSVSHSSGAPGLPENTGIYGVLRPTLFVKASGNKVRFRFSSTDTGSTFFGNIGFLKTENSVPLFRTATAESIFGLY
jgi:hypothetical protein